MELFEEFKARRQRVFEQMMDNSIAILPAATIVLRNADTEFPFRQDSYFHYLTGFNESFAIAVLLKTQDKTRYILFAQDRDPQAERWTGERVGIKGACEIYGADEAYSLSEIGLRMPEMLNSLQAVYYLVNNNLAFDKKLFSWILAVRRKIRTGAQTPSKFIDLRVILSELRLIKSEAEVNLLQKACDISARAHLQAMKHCQVGMREYEIEATLLYEFYRHGSRYPAYTPIVAAGKNACILHYTRNNELLKENELLLIDAGAEYEGYAADITRTFPINGKFSAEQKAIYELVLAAQMAAIEQAIPGSTWDGMQKSILKVLIEGLIDLKILKGNPQTLLETKAFAPFYMHNSGHWLGLDVHDVGDYQVNEQWRKLKPGMVFTVEPGLYFAHDNHQIAPQWRGIGVRIEDDVLVTADGVRILTAGVPKAVNEIEQLMAGSR